MEFIKQLKERAADMNRLAEFDLPMSVVINEDVAQCHVNGIEAQYELRLSLGSNFWARKSDYDAARKMAERSLVQLVHGETLTLISRVEAALWQSDRVTALKWLNELRTAVEHR